MPDKVEKVTERQVVDDAGGRTTTRAVSTNSRDAGISKVAQIIWFIVSVLVILLILRFILSLMGANPTNGFANFIYSLSNPFVAPFRGLLRSGTVQLGVARFEFETLVAAVVYTLLGWIIVQMVSLTSKNPDAIE